MANYAFRAKVVENFLCKFHKNVRCAGLPYEQFALYKNSRPDRF